jgi:hypothetical protein
VTRAAAVLLVVAACGDNLAAPPDVDVDPSADLNDTDAWIELALTDYPEGQHNTFIRGNTITDPRVWPYAEPLLEGACRMWERDIDHSCEPWCGLDTSCIGGVCVAPPPPRSAGTISVEGRGETRDVPFENGAYQLFVRDQPFPPGTAITVSAPGDIIGPFEMTATAPQPLELVDLADCFGMIDNCVIAKRGETFAIHWIPADPGSRVRVTLGTDLGHAMHRPVVVECDAPDELGYVVVPPRMVEALADGANWGCGICYGQEAKRYRRARVDAGDVPLSFWVVHRVAFDMRPAYPP